MSDFERIIADDISLPNRSFKIFDIASFALFEGHLNEVVSVW
jgi:hypothetical protein